MSHDPQSRFVSITFCQIKLPLHIEFLEQWAK